MIDWRIHQKLSITRRLHELAHVPFWQPHCKHNILAMIPDPQGLKDAFEQLLAAGVQQAMRVGYSRKSDTRKPRASVRGITKFCNECSGRRDDDGSPWRRVCVHCRVSPRVATDARDQNYWAATGVECDLGGSTTRLRPRCNQD